MVVIHQLWLFVKKRLDFYCRNDYISSIGDNVSYITIAIYIKEKNLLIKEKLWLKAKA